jgi:hypothetical protein
MGGGPVHFSAHLKFKPDFTGGDPLDTRKLLASLQIKMEESKADHTTFETSIKANVVDLAKAEMTAERARHPPPVRLSRRHRRQGGDRDRGPGQLRAAQGAQQAGLRELQDGDRGRQVPRHPARQDRRGPRTETLIRTRAEC